MIRAGEAMSEKEKAQFIVRAVMSEYLILMGGALLLYGAQQRWPRSTSLIAYLGGGALAVLCILNFIYVLRTTPGTSAPVSSSAGEGEP
jgi:hypothetical protein